MFIPSFNHLCTADPTVQPHSSLHNKLFFFFFFWLCGWNVFHKRGCSLECTQVFVHVCLLKSLCSFVDCFNSFFMVRCSLTSFTWVRNLPLRWILPLYQSTPNKWPHFIMICWDLCWEGKRIVVWNDTPKFRNKMKLSNLINYLDWIEFVEFILKKSIYYLYYVWMNILISRLWSFNKISLVYIVKRWLRKQFSTPILEVSMVSQPNLKRKKQQI